MSYQFLCPKCGDAFLEGTSFTKCPECQVPLLHAAPSPAETALQPSSPHTTDGELSPTPDLIQAAQSLAANMLKVSLPLGSDQQGADNCTDLAALVRDALLEQQPEEAIDATIERVAQRNYPEHADILQQSIGQLLDAAQRGHDRTRQQAAEELAKSKAEVQIGAHGTTCLRVVFPTQFHVSGMKDLKELSETERAEVEQQIADVFKSGKPISTTQIVVPKVKFKVGCAPLLLIGVVVLAGAFISLP